MDSSSDHRYHGDHKENHDRCNDPKDLLAGSLHRMWRLIFHVVQGFEPEFHGGMGRREDSFPGGPATLKWCQPLQCLME